MKMLKVEMPDGSKWGVPVEIIARNRATHYAHEYDGDVEKSLSEDTMPLFESDDYEVEDWAANNMNWVDVKAHAKLLESGEFDFQEGWVNGEKSVIEKYEFKQSGFNQWWESLNDVARESFNQSDCMTAFFAGQQSK